MNSSSVNEHPGPQKKITNRSIIKSPIHYLILFAAVSTIFSVLQANINFAPDSVFWNIEFLDITTSVTLLAATISLLYARNQFEQGLMPVLDYRITYKDTPSLDFNSIDLNSRILVCSLRNHSAVAIVTSVKYTLWVNSRSIECQDYHELIRVLKNQNLANKVDYSLLYLSKGWSLGGNDERVIFELITSCLSKNKELTGIDLHLEFRSLLGDIYQKNIYCLPRRGVNS